MKILKPFNAGAPDTYEPVALSDGTLFFIHRDNMRNRVCIIAAEDFRGYILTENDDYVTAVVSMDTDIAKWFKKNFPGEKPVRTIIVFGNEAAEKCEETSFEPRGDKPAGALKKVDRIINKTGGELVIREFNTEEERNAYYQGMNDADGWQGLFDFAELQDNPFTEEEITKQLKRQNKN